MMEPNDEARPMTIPVKADEGVEFVVPIVWADATNSRLFEIGESVDVYYEFDNGAAGIKLRPPSVGDKALGKRGREGWWRHRRDRRGM